VEPPAPSSTAGSCTPFRSGIDGKPIDGAAGGVGGDGGGGGQHVYAADGNEKHGRFVLTAVMPPVHVASSNS